MAKKKGLKTYQIGIVTTMWVDIPIQAINFNEALEISKSLNACEQFEKHYLKKDAPGINDSAAKVIQVYDPDFESSFSL